MRTDVQGPGTPAPTRARRWLPLGLGVAALIAIPVVQRVLRMVVQDGGLVGLSPSQAGVAVAIALGAAGLVTGIVALRRGERSWPVWVGTACAGLVALFWAGFALGELLFPH